MAMTSNHPVHFITKEKKKSPSSFIPFCEFGGNMSSLGIMINDFDIPVCNSFQPKILFDQLCYEVDLNQFSNKDKIEKELRLGLNFIMDYNEDRQVIFDHRNEKDRSLVGRVVESDDEQHAYIYLDTVGKD